MKSFAGTTKRSRFSQGNRSGVVGATTFRRGRSVAGANAKRIRNHHLLLVMSSTSSPRRVHPEDGMTRNSGVALRPAHSPGNGSCCRRGRDVKTLNFAEKNRRLSIKPSTPTAENKKSLYIYPAGYCWADKPSFFLVGGKAS
jgi:hypothetical protein